MRRLRTTHIRGPVAAQAALARMRALWDFPEVPKRKRRQKRPPWARRVAIEVRAAELGVDAPRSCGYEDDHPGQHEGWTAAEWKGWCLNYWDHFERRDPGKRGVHTAGCKLQRAPRTDGEWAGWLAREVFLATWSG